MFGSLIRLLPLPIHRKGKPVWGLHCTLEQRKEERDWRRIRSEKWRQSAPYVQFDIDQPFQRHWLSLKFAVATGSSLFNCFCHGPLDTLNEVCVLSLWDFQWGLCSFSMGFPGRWTLKLLQKFTTATQSDTEETWNSCADQCSRLHPYKKYSNTLLLPIVAVLGLYCKSDTLLGT